MRFLIDSGASVSYLDPDLLPPGTDITPAQGTVTLGALGTKVPSLGRTAPLTLTHKHLSTQAVLELLKTGFDGILGLDLFSKFQISLPRPPPAPADPVKEGQATPDCYVALLIVNAGNPGFCFVPESVVDLDTGVAKPVFRRQVPIPEALIPAVREVVEGLLAKGPTKRSTPGTVWNHPLLVVPKKKGKVRARIYHSRANGRKTHAVGAVSPNTLKLLEGRKSACTAHLPASPAKQYAPTTQTKNPNLVSLPEGSSVTALALTKASKTDPLIADPYTAVAADKGNSGLLGSSQLNAVARPTGTPQTTGRCSRKGGEQCGKRATYASSPPRFLTPAPRYLTPWNTPGP